MLKKILIAVVAVIVVFLGYAATRPNTLHVERTVSVKAPPERIQPLIADLHQFPSWSPYEKRDRRMKKTFTGPETGVGSKYAWEGNSEVGSGSMEITEATPTQVVMKLDFLTPFEAHNTATFSMAPKGETTDVTWAMDGPSPFISKVMGIFMNMDQMIGTDFAAGLENLKVIAEKAPVEPPPAEAAPGAAIPIE